MFASREFAADYHDFLQHLDEILESDNQKRFEKSVTFLTTCLQEGNFNKIKKYQRLPWLKAWLEATTVVAHELLQTNDLEKLREAQEGGE